VGQVFICEFFFVFFSLSPFHVLYGGGAGVVMIQGLIHRRTVHTLSTFSSVLLVTVTVTRKMFTMILSVVAFGHRLSQMQWLGVGLVFGGIGVEAQIARREKLAKEAAKKAKAQ
jgi:drug/metabolite transporter (DMT)-like permease